MRRGNKFIIEGESAIIVFLVRQEGKITKYLSTLNKARRIFPKKSNRDGNDEGKNRKEIRDCCSRGCNLDVELRVRSMADSSCSRFHFYNFVIFATELIGLCFHFPRRNPIEKPRPEPTIITTTTTKRPLILTTSINKIPLVPKPTTQFPLDSRSNGKFIIMIIF